MYAESKYIKFIIFKQTFILTKFAIRKSYRICYVVKSCILDWTRYAVPLESGRNFSTYLVQSMKHFEILVTFLILLFIIQNCQNARLPKIFEVSFLKLDIGPTCEGVSSFRSLNGRSRLQGLQKTD